MDIFKISWFVKPCKGREVTLPTVLVNASRRAAVGFVALPHASC
jgi:hypothetical protein